MRHKSESSSVPYLKILLVIFFSAAALLGGAYLLGLWLARDTVPIVTEPGEIYDPIEPYAADRAPAQDTAAAAPAAAGNIAGGVEWPVLSGERRAQLSGNTVGWGQGVEVNE